MSGAFGIVVAVSGCATAAAVVAQTATGTLIPRRETSSPVGSIMDTYKVYTKGPEVQQTTEEAIRRGRLMAGCMVKTKPKDVKAYLAATTESELNAMSGDLMPTMRRCFGKSVGDPVSSMKMGLGRSSLEGLLAEALLTQQGVPDVAAIAPASVPELPSFVATSIGQYTVAQLGYCLAASEPAAASLVLSAAPGSAAEELAFKRIMPKVSGCLGKNVTLSTNKSRLRLAIAAGLYRRMTAIRSTVSVNAASVRN